MQERLSLPSMPSPFVEREKADDLTLPQCAAVLVCFVADKNVTILMVSVETFVL
jgi:hypothetical protein